MEIYTMQLSKWRLAKKQDIQIIDCTLKSGVHHCGERWLAPTKNLLWAYKEGTIGKEQYEKEYLSIMRERYIRDKQWFIDFCNTKDPLAIACYCKGGGFCHRYLLIKILDQICSHYNIPYTYKGELE